MRTMNVFNQTQNISDLEGRGIRDPKMIPTTKKSNKLMYEF